MKIELDQDMLKSVVSEAILKSLDEQKRNALIEGALRHLLTPEAKGGFGQSVSPLELAFRDAIQWTARKVMQEEFEKRADITEKIRGLLNDALIKLTETNREETVNKLAETIAKGLSHREY